MILYNLYMLESKISTTTLTIKLEMIWGFSYMHLLFFLYLFGISPGIGRTWNREEKGILNKSNSWRKCTREIKYQMAGKVNPINDNDPLMINFAGNIYKFKKKFAMS